MFAQDTKHPLEVVSIIGEVGSDVYRCINILEDTEAVINEEEEGRSTIEEVVHDSKGDGPTPTEGWKVTVDLSRILHYKLQKRIRRMIEKYSDMYGEMVGTVSATENRILLKEETKTAHQLPYIQVISMKKKTVEEVKEQINKGALNPTSSKWASHVFFSEGRL